MCTLLIYAFMSILFIVTNRLIKPLKQINLTDGPYVFESNTTQWKSSQWVYMHSCNQSVVIAQSTSMGINWTLLLSQYIKSREKLIHWQKYVWLRYGRWRRWQVESSFSATFWNSLLFHIFHLSMQFRKFNFFSWDNMRLHSSDCPEMCSFHPCTHDDTSLTVCCLTCRIKTAVRPALTYKNVQIALVNSWPFYILYMSL